MASAAPSEPVPKQCSAVRKGEYVLIKNHPCKIVEMSSCKTGKHGHAKVHFIGLDIFTGKKRETICPSTHNIQVPEVIRKDYEIIDIHNENITLMGRWDDEPKDLEWTKHCSLTLEEIKQLREKVERHNDTSSEPQGVFATVFGAMDCEVIKEVKIGKVK